MPASQAELRRVQGTPPGVEPTVVRQRLALVDALRGIAALAVVLFHVPNEFRRAAGIPAWMDWIFQHGGYGVTVFFVLSGFVITMSMRNGPWTLRYLVGFVARRSVRLDPPYWTAIALEVLLGYVGMRWLSAKEYPLPGVRDIVAHLTYTQGILGLPQISDVFWTLCFEIQFYVGLVATLVIATSVWMGKLAPSRYVLGFVFMALLSLSVLVRNEWILDLAPGTGLIRVEEFLVGVLCFLWASNRVSTNVTAGVLVATASARIVGGGAADVAVTWAAFALCAISYKRPSLDRFGRFKVLQFLGGISYSLYLFHASIVGRASSLLVSRMGAEVGQATMLLALVVVVLATVAFAWVMCILVERPALHLSKRVTFGLRPRLSNES
ncbi:MAG: acyltransferase [Gemmatimonas sp.]|nr:acyltransferase [Gemmatimonas sp.]